jgi:hypothetical protein
MTKTQKRIYLVTNNGNIWLVRAFTQHAALSFAAKQTFKVKVASQDDLVDAVKHGHLVIETGEAASE